jgi:hypothetical protein
MLYWIIGGDNKEYGPIPAEQIRGWLAEGRANGKSFVRRDGSNQWMAASSFPEFGQAPPPLQSFAPSLSPLEKNKIKNYLIPSIVATCCCGCPPVGIVAIYYATQVDTRLSRGDFEGAMNASRKARIWCWISFILGIISMCGSSIFFKSALDIGSISDKL